MFFLAASALMASRNRARALVNKISCSSSEAHNLTPATSTPTHIPEQIDLATFTDLHYFERCEPPAEERLILGPFNTDNNADLVQLEDLTTATDSLPFLVSATPASSPTSPPPPPRPDSALFYDDFSPDDDSDYEPPNHDVISSDSENIQPNIQITDTIQEEVHYGDMTEGRRRLKQSQPEKWKKNVTKRLRMEGKEYVGYKRPRGEKVQPQIRNSRVMGPRCISNFCKKSKIRCCDEVGDDDRDKIFHQFWNDMDWHQRKVYVANNVTFQGKGRPTVSESSRRSGTLIYFLPVSNPNDGTTTKKRVCREMFLQTLCLGSFSVQSWAKKGQCGMHPSEENMNRNRRPRALPCQARADALNSFLDGLPKVPSHYNRLNTSKVYLEPIYRNINHLYSTYKQFCSEKEVSPYARNKFTQTLKSKNIAIHTIKKDMCDTCVGHQTGNVSEDDFQTHLCKKNRAREEKNTDKREAINGKCIALTMDLQSVKVCPFITASAVYYKTKLCVHNFSIYDLASHDCTCYWFTETEGDLSASTYATFITDYLTRHCLPKRLPIIIYSDGCTSQNRNNILSNALLNFSMQYGVSIVQKYLEVGHTQMEVDCVHSAIERKLKNRLIHLPSDYLSVTKEACRNPYEAIMVDYTFFKNFSSPETLRYTSIRPGRKTGDPKVTDIRAISYNKDGIIKYKLDFDSDWDTLPQRVNKIPIVREYPPLHRNRIPITNQKYKHLQELKSVIPLDCHSFYDALPHNGH